MDSQQLEKAEQEKYELQRRLKAAESGGTYAAQKVRLFFYPSRILGGIPPCINGVLYHVT